MLACMSSNPPKKHHYTPQFLLAHWAIDDGKLWRFTKPYGDKVAKKRVAPAEIGYEKDLYATPGLPPETMQRIEEKIMSPLDALAAEAHQLLLAGKVNAMPRRERSSWSRFIMSQWFRTPDGVKAMKQAIAALLSAEDPVLSAKYQALKQEGYPETLEAAITALNPHFAEQAALEVMCKLMDNPKNGQRLNNMLWGVREIEGGHDLLVSDVLLQQNSGVFSPSGYITMPIAPRKYFFAVHSPSLATSLLSMARNDLVARANRAIVRRAAHYVGATSFAQKAFIEAHFGREENALLVKGLASKYTDDAASGS